MQRKFILGDQWLYYKLYVGLKSADMLLHEIIETTSNQLIKCGLVTKWYFIRYADPHFHIRWRLELFQIDCIGDVIKLIYDAIEPFVSTRLVYKVQIDTYNREIERYGIRNIVLSESIFFLDSVMVAKMIGLINGKEGERNRWLFAMKSVDQLFNDFYYNNEQKFEYVNLLDKSYGDKFQSNSLIKLQLNKKYRSENNYIQKFMSGNKNIDSDYIQYYEIIDERSEKLFYIVKELFSSNRNSEKQLPISSLIGSYIHMMINRIFQERQPYHEFVVYNFLFRYYRSSLAKEKNLQL